MLACRASTKPSLLLGDQILIRSQGESGTDRAIDATGATAIAAFGQLAGGVPRSPVFVGSDDDICRVPRFCASFMITHRDLCSQLEVPRQDRRPGQAYVSRSLQPSSKVGRLEKCNSSPLLRKCSSVPVPGSSSWFSLRTSAGEQSPRRSVAAMVTGSDGGVGVHSYPPFRLPIPNGPLQKRGRGKLSSPSETPFSHSRWMQNRRTPATVAFSTRSS